MKGRLLILAAVLAYTLATFAGGLFFYRNYGQGLEYRIAWGPIRPYEINLSTPLGKSVTGRSGGVKAMIDPYTLFRNCPSQSLPYLTIDSDGFRRTSFSKPDSSLPIAVLLGASSAFGYGLNSDDETITSQLQKRLGSYRIINAAQFAWLSGQELSEVIHRLDEMHPALYIILDGWTDFLAAANDLTDPESCGYNSSVLAEIYNDLGVDASKSWDHSRRTWDGVRKKLSRCYFVNLRKMHGWIRSRGAKSLFVLQPEVAKKITKTQVEQDAYGGEIDLFKKYGPVENTRYPEEYEQLGQDFVRFCAQEGMHCLDLNRAPELTQSQEGLYLDHIHPNARGAEVIAEILKREVQLLNK